MPDDRIFHVNVNVTDLDRSIAFYALFGFEVVHRERLDDERMGQTLAKLGGGENGAEFALLRLGDAGSTCIDLVRWDVVVERSPQPVNERGICRIAMHTDDRAGLLRRLIDAGAAFTGPTPELSDRQGMFAVRDPDGVIIEVVTGLTGLVE